MSHERFHPSFLWICGLCSLPMLTALVSMQTDGTFAIWQIIARKFWLVTQIFEIATIVVALSQGCSPTAQLKSLAKPVRLLALLWVVNVVLATALADEPAAAVIGASNWLLHGLFAISLWDISKRWPAHWTNIFANIFPIGTAAFAVTVIGFVLTVGVGSDYNWVFSLPGFSHIRHPGYFLMPAIALSTWMIYKSSGRLQYLHTGLLAINFGFAIWNGSRGPLMVYALLLVPAVWIFAKVFARNKIRSLVSVALALFAGGFLSQSIPAPDNSAFNALSRFLGAQSSSIESFSSGRTEFWRQTITAIGQQPLVGHGGNQFRAQIPIAQNTFNHPHNSILQFAFEWGPVGALAFLALLAILAFHSLQATIADPKRNLGLFFAASAMAMLSLIDGVFYYNLPIIQFLVCALGTAARENSQPHGSLVRPTSIF